MQSVASPKTAGVVVIGNEILSGKIHDANSHFLAVELHSLGVNLLRISVIPDDPPCIGEETVRFSREFDYVFTSGGVGPTHDDVTMEGIAKGFGVGLAESPDLLRLFLDRYGPEMPAAVRKMALIPEGAEVIELGDSSFPLVSFRNIYIFPGIPEYLKRKFALVRERFRSSAIFLKRLFLRASEPDIAEALRRIVTTRAGITVGSYPVLGNDEYRVLVTLESRSAESLSVALDDLLALLPEDVIVRIE